MFFTFRCILINWNLLRMKKNVQIALHELRRLYRIAHTPPWRYSCEAYERTVTPFVYCYSVLSDTAFFMRCFCRVYLFSDASEIATNAMAGLALMKKELRKIHRSLEGLPDCQRVMAERTRIARVRVQACQSCTSIIGAINH